MHVCLLMSVDTSGGGSICTDFVALWQWRLEMRDAIVLLSIVQAYV